MTDHVLDITGDVCPLTFVKTKLLLERMATGDVARVRLKGAEPLVNVPRSVREHGHEVLSLAPVAAAGDGARESALDGVHELVIRKR